MKANETKVEDFLSANKTQFVIPVYQRNYDWSTIQCKQLLDDILEVGTNKRFDLIADRFLKIWEYPTIDFLNEADNGEINIFEAEDPKYKKLEYAIFFDQKIKVTQVTKLYIEVFKKLFEIQPETFFTTDSGVRIGLTKKSNENGLRQAVPINDTYFIESNIDNNGKFDRIKQALTIFEFEDELTIKYAKK